MTTVLVTGASGHLGGLVLKELANKNLNVIPVSRKPTTNGRVADFDKPETLVEAVKGGDRLLLISTDAIGSRIAQHKNAIEAAKKAGVKHIIYTSWPSPENTKAAVGPEHAETEKLIKESGLSYTILRNFLYTNLLLGSYESAVKLGALYGSAGNGKVAYVTREDCARIAAAELALNDYSNKIIDVTGPSALSYEDIAKIFSKKANKEIKYVDLPVSDYKAALVGAGFPDFVADLFISFDQAAKAGEVGRTTNSVEQLTGKKPVSIEEFMLNS